MNRRSGNITGYHSRSISIAKMRSLCSNLRLIRSSIALFQFGSGGRFSFIACAELADSGELHSLFTCDFEDFLPLEENGVLMLLALYLARDV